MVNFWALMRVIIQEFVILNQNALSGETYNALSSEFNRISEKIDHYLS